ILPSPWVSERASWSLPSLRLSGQRSISVTPVLSAPAASVCVMCLLQEGQQIGVDGVGIRRGYPVRKALVRFQRAVLEQLCRQRSGVGIRHDLVVIAVHHEDRHGDLL